MARRWNSSALPNAAGLAARQHRGDLFMDPIQNTGASAPLQKIYSKPVQRQIPADAPKQLPATDRLELSGVSHLLKTLKASGDVRTDKVASVKAQIESGTYDADGQKLDAATDKLLDDLMK
jgi:anti-sigma28 factor (negative regulator of flagellin synthesis)